MLELKLLFTNKYVKLLNIKAQTDSKLSELLCRVSATGQGKETMTLTLVLYCILLLLAHCGSY